MYVNIILWAVGLVTVLYVWKFWKKKQQKKRLDFIQSYMFSPVLIKRVKEKHDYLSDTDMQKVVKATRDYFYICNQAKGKMVAMPSEIVDVFWHEFLLFTREYQKFCKQGLGSFLHHTPTEVMKSPSSAQVGIKRAWRLSCAKEYIDPKNPKKLPLLFGIDTQLKIKGGFKHQLKCKGKSKSSCGGYCATHISCTSGCGGDSGASCGGSSDSDSSGGGFFSSDSNSSCSGGGSCGGGGD